MSAGFIVDSLNPTAYSRSHMLHNAVNVPIRKYGESQTTLEHNRPVNWSDNYEVNWFFWGDTDTEMDIFGLKCIFIVQG